MYTGGIWNWRAKQKDNATNPSLDICSKLGLNYREIFRANDLPIRVTARLECLPEFGVGVQGAVRAW